MSNRSLGRLVAALFILFCTRVAGAAPFAWVPNSLDAAVAVVDLATNTVVTAIPVGNGPAAIAILPGDAKVYVVNQATDNVSVIDTASRTVVATIPVGDLPLGITALPNATRVYVANQNDRTVSVINASTDAVIDTIPFPLGYTPISVTAHPDSTRVYVTAGDRLFTISTASNTISNFVQVGASPGGLAVRPGGAEVWVANRFGDNDISVVDTATNTVLTDIPVATLPYNIAFSPDGTRAYVVTNGGGTVDVVDAVARSVITSISLWPATSGPVGVSITPDGSRVYATLSQLDRMRIIDTATNTLLPTVILVGDAPQGWGDFIDGGPGVAPPVPSMGGLGLLGLGVSLAAVALGASRRGRASQA
ncbi:MAG: YncE family protein [Spirochaetaceae bacterium]|nr:YncE family protein [Myxococcales bacterium]MCB9723081.1 YncE family protein [Spirochaetaceae bacterium]HPG24153.1 YncE family protein [Myxococcota bacterium]